MSKDRLDILNSTEPPPPDEQARALAVNAALRAFEEAGRGEQKTSGAQGSAARRRPMTILSQNAWRWIMEKRMLMGTVAAGVLLFPLAAQLVWQVGAMRENRTLGLDLPPQAEMPQENRGPLSVLERLDDAQRQQGAVTRMKSEADAAAGATSQPAAEPAPAAPPVSTALEQAAPQVSFDAPAQLAKRAAPGAQYAPGIAMQEGVRPAPYAAGGDQFSSFETNAVKQVTQEPVSTFSIDVDTSSYAYMRRALKQGSLPPQDSVRVEEMINYFSYDYPLPDSAQAPFRPTVAIYPTPWNANTKLLHIGIKGLDVQAAERPRANLVFLIDVSGSMQNQDKLPLLKSAFRLLLDTLKADDTVSIVTYAGHAGTALEPTRAAEKAKIFAALDALQSGGSTAGAEGIRQAYALAEQGLVKDGVNRVLLATDGDFNVGISDPEELKQFIARKRESGVFLSVMGFGEGNYNDALMQSLAQNGNGVAAYIDTLSEAQKVLVDEAAANLFPIAKDVKIQIEFNPSLVSEYRLIGYETRALKREDFNNDKVDAGELGSGHSVTAIYELTPKGAPQSADPLRYQQTEPAGRPAEGAVAGAGEGEYAFLKLRYKLPAEDTSKLISVPVTKADERLNINEASADMRFAASVAAFGQKLRGGAYIGSYGYDEIAALAASARGEDKFGYRNEFLGLVRLAKSLDAAGNR